MPPQPLPLPLPLPSPLPLPLPVPPLPLPLPASVLMSAVLSARLRSPLRRNRRVALGTALGTAALVPTTAPTRGAARWAQVAQDADLKLLGQVGLGEGWSRLSPLIAHAQVEHLGPRLLYAAVRSKPRMVAMRSGTARCMRRDR